MTLAIIALMYGGTLLLVSGVENVSLVCSFQWVINGAQGKPSCANTTGGNGNATGPQIAGVQPSATPPGSVILNGNPFAGL